MRRERTGALYVPNAARGPVLYALVAARGPRVVLELGTGRGYGALCMARALADNGIDGTVWTIDVVPHGATFEWLLRDERGARVEMRSRQDLWAERFPREWIERIVPLAGRSRDVLRRWPAERPVELAFVDGGHDLRTARHDILGSCGLSAERFGLLADDYVERPDYGVVQAFRELFGDRPPVTVVATSWGPTLGGPGAGMAWLSLDDRPADRARLRARWSARPAGWLSVLARR